MVATSSFASSPTGWKCKALAASLVQSGLVEQHSTRRWAYYTLSVAAKTETTPVPPSDEERIIAYLREHGSINNTECRNLLQTDIQRASNLLRQMHNQGFLKREGERRWAR